MWLRQRLGLSISQSVYPDAERENNLNSSVDSTSLTVFPGILIVYKKIELKFQSSNFEKPFKVVVLGRT